MVWILSLVFVLLFSGTAGAIHTQAHRESTLLAERVGYGRNTTGGAGGTLCTVTNLNDNGAGSLRACLDVPNQATWVIFSVSGTILLQSPLIHLAAILGGSDSVGPAYSNKTIDGRGANITISTVPSSTASVSAMLYISGMNNWIIHNVTLDPGNQQGYIIRCLNCQNIWYDHIDVTGGWNNLVSLGFGMGGGYFGTSSTPSTAITISWSKFRALCHGLPINSVNCGSGMILFAQGSNDTSHPPAEPLMASATMTLHHNWYQHTSGVRHPYMRYGRAHAFNNYYDNPDQPVIDAYLGQFNSENDIFLCDQSVVDGYQCGQSNSGSTLRVKCTNFAGEGPGPGPGQAENCKVSGQWSVSGIETYEQVNPSTIFNPAADYTYTLETANAALRTKLMDTTQGAGRVDNPYNSVAAAGPPTVLITSPTSATTVTTGTTPLTPALAGSATDDTGVISVTWSCTGCAAPTSGTASCVGCGAAGTNVTWSVPTINLGSFGTKTITVTATDAVPSTGTDTLTVTFSAPDITTGLVAHYKFNDGAGTATDSTGLGHTGTFVAGASYGLGAPSMGNGLALDGTSQYVTVNDAADLDFTTGYTLAAWFFPTATLVDVAGIIKHNTAGPGYAYYLYPGLDAACPTNGIVAGWGTGSTDKVCYGTALTPNQWTHVAVTYDGTTLTLYVGGVSVATAPAAATTASTAPLQLGHSQFGEFFPGRMDEVRLYNRGLTAADMAALAAFNDGITPSTATTLKVIR